MNKRQPVEVQDDERMEIDGIEYVVVSKKSFEYQGTRYEVRLRRPRGRRIYVAIIYPNGSVSSVTPWV